MASNEEVNMRNSIRTKADWERLVAENRQLREKLQTLEFTWPFLMNEINDLERHGQALDADLAQWVRLARHLERQLPEGHPLRPTMAGIKASETLLGRTVRGPEPSADDSRDVL